MKWSSVSIESRIFKLQFKEEKMFNKIVIVAVFLCSIFVTNAKDVYANANEQSMFRDVAVNHWAYPAIVHIINKNYMSKTSSNYFSPNISTTRVEAAVAISRAIGNTKESSTFIPKFKDVKPTDSYYKEVCHLASLGVIQNTEYFNPNEPLKRTHIAKILSLAFDIKVDQVNKHSFRDVGKSHWAKNYVESMADAAIINGIDGVNFAPNRNVTRAQLAGLLERTINFQSKIDNQKIIYDYLAKDYIDTINYSQQWTLEVVRLVNIERQKGKLSLLKEQPKLSQLAVVKAQDMIRRNYFNHVSPFYGQPWDLAALFDYPFTSFGENIARNFNSPQAVVNAWMNSPNHRANILKSNYTDIGVGMRKSSDGSIYWVQLFSSN